MIPLLTLTTGFSPPNPLMTVQRPGKSSEPALVSVLVRAVTATELGKFHDTALACVSGRPAVTVPVCWKKKGE
jgi:hypothetical protein